MVYASGLIDPTLIIEIESSGNPSAHNKKTDARGLYQITPICLKHFNKDNPLGLKFKKTQLFSGSVNTMVGTWYLAWLTLRCKDYKEVIIAWNAGYGNLLKYRKGKFKLKKETKNFLKKYEYLKEKRELK